VRLKQLSQFVCTCFVQLRHVWYIWLVWLIRIVWLVRPDYL
jgi:hypothetical protein